MPKDWNPPPTTPRPPPPRSQGCVKHLALIASGEARNICPLCLQAEVEQLQAKLHCMCGSEINHSAWEGHTPVSMYDYALDRAEAEIERLKTERDADVSRAYEAGVRDGKASLRGNPIPPDATYTRKP